jgi:hypothetical protein
MRKRPSKLPAAWSRQFKGSGIRGFKGSGEKHFKVFSAFEPLSQKFGFSVRVSTSAVLRIDIGLAIGYDKKLFVS